MMAIDEVFPNPTVKEVHFEIRFPNLFYIESKMGDFQLAIMERFPKSSEILRRHMLLADWGAEGKLQPPPEELESPVATKSWRFQSDLGLEVDVRSNHLGIKSSRHRTYNNPAAEERFRDLVEFVLAHFLAVTKVPTLTRIGLRYVDDCPVPNLTNSDFQSYYNTTFPLHRFDISTASELYLKTVVAKGQHFLTYQESLAKDGDAWKLIMDFDAYSHTVTPNNWLSVTDDLHTILVAEFEASIKTPVYAHMRGAQGASDDPRHE